MRRIWTYIFLFGSTFAVSAHAATVSCAQLPGGSSCSQCYSYTLAQSNKASDTFVPRTGLSATQTEWIDITQSSVTATAFQGIVVSPVGNITSQFNLVDHGTGHNSWIWAQMKSTSAITRGAIPAGINYSTPAYLVKFNIKSNIKDNGVLSPNTGATHTECNYFFITAPAAPVCGNGIREGNEQCDDGNTNNNDSCSNACTIVTPGAICGNGIREGAEQCDDGNSNNTDGCSNSCRTPVCGNAIREGNEQCDDGNLNNNDGCSNSCILPICGNGIREGNEQCDDGNRINNDRCTNTCQNPGAPGPVCGNGIREGNEQCDDGNLNNNDGCSNQCTTNVINPRCNVQVLDSNGPAPLRTSISCSGQPQGRTVIAITKNNAVLGQFETVNTQYTFVQAGHYTVHCYPNAIDQSNSCSTSVDVGGLCGNGIVERGEQCDDGNTISGDGCDRYCRVEGSICGNGILERGEQCDDGNNDNGDSCSNICQRYTPDTGPSDVLWLILGISTLVAGLVTYRKYLRL